MRQVVLLAVGALCFAGCGSNNASAPTATPAATATAAPKIHSTATPRPKPLATSAAARPTPSPTVVITHDYAQFTTTICRALATRDANIIINSLPYFQYNSGLRYGNMGDGEGQTADPSLARSWLASGKKSCAYYSPGVAGHGTVLASGWTQPGGWALIELDTFSGHWKINDFTFGDRTALYNAMQTAGPILAYRG